MASRNLKPSSVQGFDAGNINDKMQSSTLKRQPSPDWSKTDLLRLLSYFEGELQARDITIATLKAEKAKQLLYQAKYGRFGLGDPFVALQRDAEGKNDTGFDEAAIKSMYDNQLAQLENLIATQRKAQLKMREQLGNSEKRFHKVCSELEEEKQKHAQDTAQGDDVTYMLEKERERLKAEIDFEKNQNKKLEKDLKKTLASLEEERANAARHKQVAIMLIKERKNLIERIIAENQIRDEMESALTDGKCKIQNMAEGLAQESKKSLKMEAALDKQSSKFDSERETLRMRLQEEEKQTNILRTEVARLSKQLESLQQQVRSSTASPSGGQIRSTVSPGRTTNPLPTRNTAVAGSIPNSVGVPPQSVSPSINNNPPQGYSPQPTSTVTVGGIRSASSLHPTYGASSKVYTQSNTKVSDSGRLSSNSPEKDVIYRPENHPTGTPARRGPGAMRMGPVGAPGMDRAEADMGPGARVVNVAPGSSATVTTHGGGKISFHVAGAGPQVPNLTQVRKSPGFGATSASPVGRGVPPPIPPNKPNIVSPLPGGGRPSPPPKVSVVGSAVIVQTPGPDHHPGHYSAGKTIAQQIPVSVGGGLPGNQPSPSGAVASVRTQVRETSPSAVRKTSQPVVDSPPLEHLSTAVKSSDSSHPLEFLGAEMANLQKLLATMRTDEASTSNSHVIATETRTSSSSYTPTSSSSSTHGKTATPFSLVESPSHSQPGAVREQNNNTLKLVINNQDVKTSATAQIGSPTSIPLHVYDENLTTTPTKYSTHHIVSPTSVSSAFTKSLPSPSAEFPAPVSQLSLHSNQQLTANSPSAKRRSIPSRSRSKSPTKTAHFLPRSTSSQIFNSSKPPQDSWSLFQVNTPNQAVVVDSTAESLPLIYNLVCSGDVIALHKHLKTNPSDVSLALKDGSTALHYAADCNQESCLKLLLDNRAKPNSPREDKITPLHIAASKGHSGCLRLLLSNDAVVNPASATSQTPLHLAAKSGHFECCQLLLRHGADILFTAQDNLTAIHYAVQGNQPDILKLILDKMNFVQASDAAYQILNITDKDGWTVTHMAAYLPSPDCLLVLAESLPLDLNAKDKLGRSVKVVASPACKDAISDLERLSVPKLKVVVELRYILENTTVSNVQIGTMDVEPGYSWKMIEDQLRSTLHFYLAQLGVGLKTRRITRLDGEADRQDKEFSLGLTMANIKHFEMGYYKWTPGMQTDTAPYVMIANNNQLRKITVVVDDAGNMCELIAFDVLQPVYSINNYLRLLEQYKSVIFYGPSGSGKSYLAQRLAQSIAAQEIAMGRKPAIYQLQLEQGYSWSNFLTFLKQKNCVVPIDKGPDNVAPILVLDNLEMVDISRVFGELLDAMEYRGIKHAFYLRGDGHSESGMHYLTNQFYLIGTMNKSRSLGVDLSILPRFRWVQFRLDTEPLRGLLARHFLRRIINTYHGHLPSPEDPVLRAVEWIVCVWQRLNDSLNKLGFLEVVLGPCMFFKCPLEKQDHRLILEWMKNLWNQKIAPRVRESVKRGTGSEAPTEGQQKVANTALYVLMQRSVMLGCPLTGQEKDSYLAGFSGSNELDIPLKPGDRSRVSSSSSHLPRKSQHHVRPGSLDITGSSYTRRPRSEVEDSTASQSVSPTKMKVRNGREERRVDSASNTKRRSLSESSVNKAAQLELQQQVLDGLQAPSSSSAKVAKLEVKSPKFVSIAPTAFRAPSLSSPMSRSESSSPQPGQAALKTGRISPLLSLVVSTRHTNPIAGQKKSWSSENIAGSDLYSSSGKLRSPGPFSFSLTTPKSNLSAFKFLDKADDTSSILSEQMPDFSVFDKVPTPTEELPPSRNFVFTKQPESQVGKHVEDWGKSKYAFRPIQSGDGDFKEKDTYV